MKYLLFDRLAEADQKKLSRLKFHGDQVIDWGAFHLLKYRGAIAMAMQYHLELQNQRVGWCRHFYNRSDLREQFVFVWFNDGTYAEATIKFGRTKGGDVFKTKAAFYWGGELIASIDDRKPPRKLSALPVEPFEVMSADGTVQASIENASKLVAGANSLRWQQGDEAFDFRLSLQGSHHVFPRNHQQIADLRNYFLVNVLFRTALHQFDFG